MAVRASKFVSAVAAGLFVGMPLAIAQPAATAAQPEATAAQPATTAPDCLTAPRQETPQGQHWYYHVERGTKRRCWHLGEEGGKAAQAAPSADSSSAADASAGQAEPAGQSLQDARAEFPEPQPAPAAPQNNADNAPAQAAPAGTPTATPAASTPLPDQAQAVSGANSPVDSRWPAPNTTDSAAAPPSQPAAAPPSQLAATPPPQAAAAPTDPGASAQAAPPTVAPAPSAVESPPKASAQPSASLQMLLVVILGALALAGLTASVVFRLGRSRKIRIDAHQRRGAIWEAVDRAPRPRPQQQSQQLWAEDEAPQPPPWVGPVVEPVIQEPALRPRAARSTAQAAVPQERYQKIEELLAQLVKQAQDSDA